MERKNKSKRPAPVNQEAEFNIDELFFSKTDFVGNIESSNSVFVSVSQYTKEELIGQPHNIIRHPDMPRVIFKLLWDYIKAKKTILAFVKNMTKQGQYYWVLAAVFPVSDGYLSIRLKPSSHYAELIIEIYGQLLEAEGEDGDMEASHERLEKILQEKGFKDYDSFMSAVLIEEINSRQKNINAKNAELAIDENGELSGEILTVEGDFQRQLSSVLGNVQSQCNNISGLFQQLFAYVENFINIESLLKEKTTAILEFSEAMSMLSLNAGIECHHVGENGRTLSVVAKKIKNKSERIEDVTKSIVDFSDIITTEAEEIGVNFAIPRVQADMVAYFAKELYAQSKVEEIKFQEFKEAKDNILLLGKLFLKTFEKLEDILSPLHTKVTSIIKLIETINKEIDEVEKSLPAGNIEAARIGDQGTKFILTFKSIFDSAQVTKAKLIDFDNELKQVIKSINLIGDSSEKFLQNFDVINTSVNSIKEESLV